MAIIATYEKCLDSPYLFRDPDAPARVGALLSQAADRLEAALNVRDQPKGDPADVVLFSYEAMFASIRALVYAHGLREAGLRCLLAACGFLYVRDGQLAPELLLAFERAQGLKATPDDALAAAAALVRRTIELLAPAGADLTRA
jgi:uncharacterized protein (UPF0332 family)